jgi:DNA-binding MarR family transcriptional regulator
VDWQAVARAETHPLRVRIIERVAAEPEARFSSVELAEELGEKLGNVPYHVRSLHASGLLQRAGHRTVRCAMQRYYSVGVTLILDLGPTQCVTCAK